MEIEELIDIETVVIRRDLPKEERIMDYLKQVKNPYKYKWRNYTVEIVHNPNGDTLENCLKKLIHTIQNKQE